MQLLPTAKKPFRGQLSNKSALRVQKKKKHLKLVAVAN